MFIVIIVIPGMFIFVIFVNIYLLLLLLLLLLLFLVCAYYIWSRYMHTISILYFYFARPEANYVYFVSGSYTHVSGSYTLVSGSYTHVSGSYTHIHQNEHILPYIHTRIYRAWRRMRLRGKIGSMPFGSAPTWPRPSAEVRIESENREKRGGEGGGGRLLCVARARRSEHMCDYMYLCHIVCVCVFGIKCVSACEICGVRYRYRLYIQE